jgi:cyclophilin family peptidyl-prolyl cis-trans isomerase
MAKQWSSQPDLVIDAANQYRATIRTNHGDITVELFADRSPTTVNNFVFLAREGFYDGVIFHRVIKGFMIQGGDPTGTGSGGPGYRFRDELDAAREFGYGPGILAMANAGPNTNGSQFFLMHRDNPLPPAYAVFGRTVAGQDVIDAIATTPTGPGDRPVADVVIVGVDVVETAAA